MISLQVMSVVAKFDDQLVFGEPWVARYAEFFGPLFEIGHRPIIVWPAWPPLRPTDFVPRAWAGRGQYRINR
jgi:hypothetical protein